MIDRRGNPKSLRSLQNAKRDIIVNICNCLFSCQRAVLNELDLGPNIARNTALSENVFMMVVCIELRIPLFVVGKPGSSKSLAKTVVADNMQGDAAKSKLFRNFKQVKTQAHFDIRNEAITNIRTSIRFCLPRRTDGSIYYTIIVVQKQKSSPNSLNTQKECKSKPEGSDFCPCCVLFVNSW